jgi:hypothetical protein
MIESGTTGDLNDSGYFATAIHRRERAGLDGVQRRFELTIDGARVHIGPD